ncbi:unnamed protein product [Brugia timori]|uniref:Uncharacterized protein n=1 Tax=Brugia timori TaxID=42155 RepID=A0A0R3QIH3_9BILA|nr:unnamed protein product [Brugia timori]
MEPCTNFLRKLLFVFNNGQKYVSRLFTSSLIKQIFLKFR